MSFKNFLKIAAVAAVVYGAYKLGESHGESKNTEPQPEDPDKPTGFHGFVDDVLERNKNAVVEQIDDIRNLLKELRSKPNRTRKDNDNIDLLEIKLKQLNKE